MRKIYTLLLILGSFLLVFPLEAKAQADVWDGSVSRWTRGNGTENDPYIIDSASHLAYLSQAVMGGSFFADTFFVLANDMDLNHLAWTPIGRNANKAFMGTFNGNHHAITNMNCVDTINHQNAVYVGLFGYTLDAHISNLTLEAQILVSLFTYHNLYVGGIVAYGFASLIEDCVFEGSITVYASNSYAYAGGILSYSSSGTGVQHCVNKGSIYASSQGTAYAGGIMADCDNATPLISHCHNEANVYATGYLYAYAGGIAAKLNYGAAIQACYNTGKIETYSNSNTYAGGIAGVGTACSITSSFNEGELKVIGYDHAYGGGIVGFTEYPSIVSDCYNQGNLLVSSYFQKSFVGGIVGHIYNYAMTPTIVSSCYQTGTLQSISSFRAFSGGIAGEIVNNARISQCYYLQSTVLMPTNAAGMEVDAPFLRALSTVDTLNQSRQLWLYDEAFINKGYPLLLQSGKGFVITDIPSIQMASITLKARVIERADSVCSRGFAYKKQSQSVYSYLVSDTGNAFQANLYALEADTSYICKAFAVFSKDTVYGNTVLFSIGDVKVQTLAVNELFPHSVTFNASISYGNDTVLQKGFQWKAVADAVYSFMNVSHVYFSATCTDMLSNTAYMYRAYAVTALDTIFGDFVYFATPIQQSQVVTTVATELTPYTASLHAYVMYGDDSILYRGFEWKSASETQTYSLLLTDTTFSTSLTALYAGTDYVYRGFVITATDTIYGAYMAFSTLQACVLTTYAATLVDLHSAVLHGAVLAADEQVYMQGFAWRKLSDTSDFLVQVQGTYITDTLLGLESNTSYTFRVFAITPSGIFYGNDTTFTTLSYTSYVETIDAEDIAVTSAVIKGKVTQGEESILMQGFEWRPASSTNYTIRQVDGDDIQDTLTNLSPKTNYYFRAFILTAHGTMYGETLSFTTLEDTDIPINQKENRLTVFPNPANDYLVLTTDEACVGSRIEIVDMYGKVLLMEPLKSTSMQLDISNFADGLYFLQLKQGNKTVDVLKIVKY